MTQEERQLLFKDLCARLPYKPYLEWDDGRVIELNPISYETIARIYFQSEGNIIRPYLRPMSSMTDEEVKELLKVHLSKYSSNSDYNNIISIDRISTHDRHSWSAWLHYKTESGDNCQTCFIVGRVNWETTLSEIDWLNAHHFDYRGLIHMGLAIEAPENMYKTE